ncbi:PREDICTED: Retrovirus-related Pol poly from transposon [Prunus dulcis]|uniref:PREDICTED: Retrovirus-related Pol poly from transposon n=1 Tax=Prunus dulcis TaxID=3755 RepID=A0A5E4GBI2_PRUDU|nr:uncharacterized protein LOC117625632 [Prunus dulcis]VVA37169.1 PREDICTED: Retrovirus-related Pol poly from transposon [Prunus dulcis]
MANKTRIHGEKMGDVTVIEKILRSMTPKFNYVVCSIEESNDLDTISIDKLQSSLLMHERSMNGHVGEEQALKVIMKINQEEEVEVMADLEEEEKTKANYVEANEEMLLMVYVVDKNASKEELWFLDSGCSNHMCGKKKFFSDIDESFRVSVKLGNNSSIAVMGKGNI